jgi:hypothetical protein
MVQETDLVFRYEHHVEPTIPTIYWGGHYEVYHKPSGLTIKSKDLTWYDNKYKERKHLRAEISKLVKEKTN